MADDESPLALDGLAPPKSPTDPAATPPAAKSRRRGGRPSSAADRPPAPPRAAPKVGRPPRNNLKGRLTETIGGIGIMVFVVNAGDGQAILAGADNLASALDALAAENVSVYNTLEKVLAVSAWGQVATASAAIVLPILSNHGIVPPIVGQLVAPAPTPAPADGQ